MIKNIGIVSLGCPKNLVDSEVIIGILNENGFKIVGDFTIAEVLIVNTCGFIDQAKQESINTILELAEYKNMKCEKLIVVGCLAERYKEEVIREIPEVDVVLGVGNIDKIIEAVKGNKKVIVEREQSISYIENIDRYVDRSKSYAYLKIAEGCDNCCSYCVIPSIRGSYKSRDMNKIIEEAKSLVAGGIRELILVAQDTTKYGLDLYGEKRLASLLREISTIQDLKWLRILYCYPDEIDDNLINEFKTNKKLVKYIDVPIQHINNDVLKRMNRKCSKEDIIKILNKMKKEIPNIIIRTSIITGFPGETETQHIELCNFIEEFKFDRLGVFKYSEEDGTKAAKFNNKINEEEKEKRFTELMTIQNKIAHEILKNKQNDFIECVVEGVADDGIFYYGRSYAEAPEIDGLVYFTSMEELKFNQYVCVKILNSYDYDLIGEVKNEFTK